MTEDVIEYQDLLKQIFKVDKFCKTNPNLVIKILAIHYNEIKESNSKFLESLY